MTLEEIQNLNIKTCKCGARLHECMKETYEPEQLQLDLSKSWAVFQEREWLGIFPDEAHAHHYKESLNHREIRLGQTPKEYQIRKVTHNKGR